jgi:hypothetical protein
MAHGFGVSHLLVVLAAVFVIAVPVLAIDSGTADAWIKAVEKKPKATVTTKSTGTSRTIVVAQSGKANFRDVQSAINAVPNGNQRRVVIVIGPGVYRFKLVTMSLRCLQDSQKSHRCHFLMTALFSIMFKALGFFTVFCDSSNMRFYLSALGI